MREPRENMDQMLQQVRDYVFQADEALKESQRSFSRDGAGQLETIALKEIRDDIWALEDKVRAAKWAATAAEQAELANQIDPLMLQVMAKCQQHRDQIKACQGLLSNIVSWCERGTSAYRFAIHESAVTKATSNRYSSSSNADTTMQGRVVPASRIPAYKSPTKQSKGTVREQQAQLQQQQQRQLQAQQPTLQVKSQSRIPQPQLARRSLPDAEQQCSTQDQAGRDRTSSAAATTGTVSTEGRVQSSAARFGAVLKAAAPAPTAAAAVAAAPRGSGLVAAAAAAFEGSRAAATGPVPASSTVPALEGFVPLDLDANDDGQLLATAVQADLQQHPQPAEVAGGRPQQERLSNSSSCGSGLSTLQSRSSAGRVPRSLLQLEPSRDDVSLSSAGQLLQQQSSVTMADAVAGASDTQAPAPALVPIAAPPPSAASSAAVGPLSTALRFSGSLATGSQGSALQLRVPRPSYASDTPSMEAGSAADFSDFGPLHSFTPLVGQQVGSSTNPFAASGGYLGDRSSLRTSQDISMLLRSGMLMEAALLSSNASRMHIIHDAVAKKPNKPDGEPEVPVVPARLAVHKRRPWWAQAARVVVGTAAMAVAGAAGAAAAAKHNQGGDQQPGGLDHGLHGLLRPLTGQHGCKDGKQQRRQRQQQAVEESAHQLPFAPMGPAPDASAGCG